MSDKFKQIKQNLYVSNCPHCDASSVALKYPLKITQNFRAVCDVHPIVEGHILLIPKSHISCIGVYPNNLLKEFIELYNQFYQFIKTGYRKVSSFEHGVIGQTVFHSHVHLLPFVYDPLTIVPEGKKYLTEIKSIKMLKKIFQKEKKYLFFSIGKQMWIVDINLGIPRFFRDRFAQALSVPERGNWKTMDKNLKLMQQVEKDIRNLKHKWKQYCSIN